MFTATIQIIGINPYVLLPPHLLQKIMKEANKDRGPIPVKVNLNGKAFPQTLVKYSGEWRLYLNTPMRQHAGKDVGDCIKLEVVYDAGERTIPFPPRLKQALMADPEAQARFTELPPSRQKEILRYLGSLKSEAAIEKNIARALAFLKGKERFIGRDKP